MFGFGAKGDEQDISLVLAGQSEHFGVLVHRYLPVIEAIACARLGSPSDAEDVAQETFVKAYLRLDQLRDRKRFRPWLASIARNLAADLQKRRARDRELMENMPADSTQATDFARRELQQAVRKQIDALDADLREVLLLRYFAGQRTREIAATLDLTDAAVRKRLQRAREALGERLMAEIPSVDTRATYRKEQTKRILSATLAMPPAWMSGVGVGSMGAAAAGGTALAGGALVTKAVKALVLLALCGAAWIGVASFRRSAAEAPRVSDSPAAAPVQTAPEPVAPVDDGGGGAVVQPAATAGATAQGITVSGNVLGTDGTPIEGAKVIGAYWGSKPRHPDAEARSGPDGRYVLVLDQPWEIFLVRADKAGYAHFTATQCAVPEDGLTDVNYTLYREGSIEGRVVDRYGNGIPDKSVAALKVDADGIRWSDSTRSDELGRFKLASLLPGEWSMGIAKEEEYSYDGSMEAARVELKEGEQRTGVSLLYEGDGLVIAGRVIDEQGAPIANAFVQVLNGNNPRNTYTDGDGAFRATHLPAGRYFMYVSEGRYSTESREVAAGAEGVEFVLRRRGSVSGVVLDDVTGQPIQHFQIQAVDGATTDATLAGGDSRFQQVDQAEGKYHVENVPLDKATIVAKAEGYMPAYQLVELTPEQHLEGVVIRLQKGFALTGKVVNAAGAPVADAFLLVGPPPVKPAYMDGTLFIREVAKTALATSGADGTFTLEGLVGGPQMISAYQPDAGAGSVSVELPAPGNKLSDAIVLSKGGTIRGTVFQGQTPLKEVVVMATAVGGLGRPYAMGHTGGDGLFVLSAVPPGPFSLSALVQKPGDVRGGRRLMQTVEVQDGQDTVVNLVFSEAVGAIDGTVAVSGISDVSGTVQCTATTSSGEDVSMTAIRKGTFHLDDVPAGTATLLVTANVGDGFGGQALAGSCSRRLDVSVAAGEVATVSIVLSGQAKIIGSVAGVKPTEHGVVQVLAGNVALSQVDMAAISALLPLSRGSAMVAPDGTYTVEHLEAGTYTVLAWASASNGPDFTDTLRYAVIHDVSLGDEDARTLDFNLQP